MKKLFKIAIVVFLLLALPAALLLSRQRQEIRKKAAGNAFLAFSNENPPVGSPVTATLRNVPVGTVWAYGKIILPSKVTVIGTLIPDAVKPLDAIKVNEPRTYELYGGARSASEPFSGNLFSVTFTINPDAEGIQTVQYQLTTVDINGTVTTNTGLMNDATFTVQGAATTTPTATPQPFTVTGTAVQKPASGADAGECLGKQANCVEFTITSGVDTTGASVAIKLANGTVMCPTGSPNPTIIGNQMVCTWWSGDLKKTEAGATTHKIAVGNLPAGALQYVVFASNTSGVNRSSLNSFTVSGATPTATPGIILPDKALWYSLLTIPAGAYNASYDLWPVATKDNKVNGFDYVRWLDLGGHF